MALLKRLGYSLIVGVSVAVFTGLAAAIAWDSLGDVQVLQVNGDIDPSVRPYGLMLMLIAFLFAMNAFLYESPDFDTCSIQTSTSSLENDDEWEDEVVWPRKGPRVSPRW